MKLAVSSIAWSQNEEDDIASLLQVRNIREVELAPTKIWKDPTVASDEEIERVTKWWNNNEISVGAFQSMLFSRPDLKLFEDERNRSECLEYLKGFIVLAGKMGATRMVFGSPKNRQRNGLPYADAFNIAVDFFREIGETAVSNGVVFCIEPNAPQYNCDFITNAKEGADIVQAVNHPGFGLHLDAACMALAGDDPYAAIKEYGKILQHYHISSPMLEQVEYREDIDHAGAAAALKEISYDKTISIEMRPGNEGANVERVKKAIEFSKQTYCN